MTRWLALSGVVLLVFSATAEAGRIPMVRTPGQRDHGVRVDLTVPYTTNGSSNFRVWDRVSPRIYTSPTEADPADPQVKPVFNLIYYGSVQSFGGRSNGAVIRPR
jgi:hypothetical protein